MVPSADKDAARAASPPASMREEILHQASFLFAKRGYFGTSTRQIAEAAGIRQPSLFHHFATKEAVVQALLSYSLDAPSEYAVAMQKKSGAPGARLYSYVRFDSRHLTQAPYSLSGLHTDDVMETPGFEPWRLKRDAIRNAVQSLIEAGVRKGEFIAIDPQLGRHMVIDLLLASIDLYSGRSLTDADTPDVIAGFALRALSVEGEAAVERVRGELQP